MNTMQLTGQMAGDGLFPQVLIHAGYILTACAFLLRDILWLRAVAIFANISVGTAAYLAGPGSHWDVVAWTAAFATINLGHGAWLIYERHLVRFTDAERRLHASAFRALDAVPVRKLLRRGRWDTFAPETCIARQGVHLDRLILVAEGEAAVLLGGRIVALLKPGDFVGEIAFLTEEPATASVVALTELRCLVWPTAELRKTLERHHDLRNAIHAAMGRDMAAKTASHNLKLSEV